MANSYSCPSDAGVAITARDIRGPRLGILRRRNDARHVGLSPTSDPHICGSGSVGQRASDELVTGHALTFSASANPPAGHDEAEAGQRRREISLLADLLVPYAGESAFQISYALLDCHGSIASLLVQMRHRLPLNVELPGDAIARIEDLMTVMLHTWEVQAYRGPVLSSSAALRRYLQIDMAGAPRENFRVLFLNAANHLLLDRVMWEGSVSSVQAHPREIVRLALMHNATALILAHNHPSGCMRPSREDIKITQIIARACASLDICVHDHLIVTRNGVGSVMHP